MKKGQVYEGIIEKVAFPNKCHIQVDGKTVVVKNGVPGQKVRFSVNKVRSGKAEGFWRSWKNLLWSASRYALILQTVADVLIRICPMRHSWI